MTMTPDDSSDVQTLPDWVGEYLRGATQQQIADRLGFTKPHVGNLLKKYGVPPRSTAETTALRDKVWLQENGSSLRTEFLTSRDLDASAAALGLSPARTRRLLGETVPDWRVLAAVPRRQVKKYTREELLASLKSAAATVATNLTVEQYRTYVGDHPELPDGRRTPGEQAVELRFGSWGRALGAAGLPANARSGPTKHFDDPGAVIVALVECWREIGRPPTVGDYDLWQRGKSDHPGAATSRRLIGSWNLAQVRAWQVVHDIHLDQDDPDVAVPESVVEDVIPDAG